MFSNPCNSISALFINKYDSDSCKSKMVRLTKNMNISLILVYVLPTTLKSIIHCHEMPMIYALVDHESKTIFIASDIVKE